MKTAAQGQVLACNPQFVQRGLQLVELKAAGFELADLDFFLAVHVQHVAVEKPGQAAVAAAVVVFNGFFPALWILLTSLKTEAELVSKGAELMSRLELDALLVTRGEHGMTLLRPDHAPLHLPARAREVFDVTGAGDTVISTLAAAIAAGEELPQAVALANLAAGIVVGKLGTACISAPELRRAVQREEGSERGVMTVEQLLTVVEDARAEGEKIVFTNGCFDILHAGHVTYLEQARAQGDRLVVAVNDDGSVSRLKGPGRPINSVDRRMAVLAGLEAVDWVVCFSEDTPENLLAQVRPDVLVKGGDYGVDQVVGADLVKAYGGVVKVLGLVENSSTTAIVEKIRKA